MGSQRASQPRLRKEPGQTSAQASRRLDWGRRPSTHKTHQRVAIHSDAGRRTGPPLREHRAVLDEPEQQSDYWIDSRINVTREEIDFWSEVYELPQGTSSWSECQHPDFDPIPRHHRRGVLPVIHRLPGDSELRGPRRVPEIPTSTPTTTTTDPSIPTIVPAGAGIQWIGRPSISLESCPGPDPEDEPTVRFTYPCKQLMGEGEISLLTPLHSLLIQDTLADVPEFLTTEFARCYDSGCSIPFYGCRARPAETG